MSRHELVVMVRDDGSPAKHSFCRVLISVMDANNHAPEFIGDSLVGQVDEGAAPGTVVLKLMAFDRDTSNNGRLTYEAVSGNLYELGGVGICICVHVTATLLCYQIDRPWFYFALLLTFLIRRGISKTGCVVVFTV